MKKIKRNYFILLLSVLTLFSASIKIEASEGDFYTRLFSNGKKMYLEGEFKEAAKDLRIAQFGLQEKPEILKELYLYYALSNYKLKRGDKVVKISKKLLDLYNVPKAEMIKKPEIIKNDLDLMFSAVFKNYQVPEKKIKPKVKIRKTKAEKKRFHKANIEKKFNKKFSEVKSNLDSNLLKETLKGIKDLEKIKRRDARTGFLKGILAFRKRNYKQAIIKLTEVYNTGIPDLKDETSYFLSLSHYFYKNYGQSIAFYQKIIRRELKKKLTDIINKVRNIRENIVLKNANELFNKKDFRNVNERFKGDIFIPRDILQKVISSEKIGLKQIKSMVNYCLKHNQIYERGFILLASGYFSDKNDLKYAIRILKNSKFFLPETPENIEVLYRAGLYYFRIKSFGKAKKMFKKVLKLIPSYKKTYFYLDKLKNLN